MSTVAEAIFDITAAHPKQTPTRYLGRRHRLQKAAHKRTLGAVSARSLARRTMIGADPVEHKFDPRGYDHPILSQPV
jgi:hypothetical protein